MRISAFLSLIPAVVLAASFEVATIKPAVPDAFGSSGEDGRNGVLKVYNMTLKDCIGAAYGVAGARVLGGPKWIGENSYDILAKASHPATEPELIAMLKPLLAERFQLVVHRETRQMAGYALTLAKDGIKAQAADPTPTSGSDGGRGRIDFYANRLSQLCIRLSGILGRPVIDETGDTRKFDFHLRWAPDDGAPSDGPSLFSALQEQLGLKLESRKVDAEVVVIDHAELPSAN